MQIINFTTLKHSVLPTYVKSKDFCSLNSSLAKTKVSVSVGGSALHMYKSGEIITDGNYVSNKYAMMGVISLDKYVSASDGEKYLGYVNKGYPSLGVIPITAVLTTHDNSMTQDCTVYLKTNGGLYLSTPQTLKSTSFSEVWINDEFWTY